MGKIIGFSLVECGVKLIISGDDLVSCGFRRLSFCGNLVNCGHNLMLSTFWVTSVGCGFSFMRFGKSLVNLLDAFRQL